MTLNERLKSIERKYAIGLISLFVGIFMAFPGVYSFFFEKDTITLRYEIVSSYRVLDIRAEISKLNIIYDNLSLKERKLNLRLIFLRIVNESNKGILLNYYDDTEPLGLKIEGGRILELPETLEASSDYLKRSFIQYFDSNRINFSKKIIDGQQSILIKLMLLESDSVMAKIIPVGKVAGVSQIELSEPYLEVSEKSAWEKLFAGNPLIQLVRMISYSILFFVLIFTALVIAAVISEYKREAIVREFKTTAKIKLTNQDKFIFERYADQGGDFITKTNIVLVQCALYNASLSNTEINPELAEFVRKNYNFVFRDKKYFKKLINSGFITLDGDTIHINPHMAETFDSFTEFLDKKGLVKRV